MSQYREKDYDDTVVLRGDVQFTFVVDEGVSGEPKVGDELLFASGSYKVINVNPVSPNGLITLCYKLQARK